MRIPCVPKEMHNPGSRGGEGGGWGSSGLTARRDSLTGMNSTEIITAGVLLFRPWLILTPPLTTEQVYHHASEILAGSTGGSMIS